MKIILALLLTLIAFRLNAQNYDVYVNRIRNIQHKGLGTIGGATIDSAGNIYYVTGTGGYSINKVSKTGIYSKVAGVGTYGYSKDGTVALQAKLETDFSVLTTDNKGNIYFSERSGVRKINSKGIITTVVSADKIISPETVTGANDGTAFARPIDGVFGMACDPSGDLFMACGSKGLLRVGVNGEITTLTKGDSLNYHDIDDSEPVHNTYSYGVFYKVQSVIVYNVVYSKGNLYISVGPYIQKVDLNGNNLKKVAGSWIHYSQNPSLINKSASDSVFLNTYHLASDEKGNIYFDMSSTYTVGIDRLNPDGGISVVLDQDHGDNDLLTGMVVDKQGSLYAIMHAFNDSYLRRIGKGTVPLENINLKKATTLDAKSVSVDYEIKDADAISIHFDIYRSSKNAITDLSNITINDDLIKLGETTITSANPTTADQLTKGEHDKVTILSDTKLPPDRRLPPDTRMPYIIVVASCNDKKEQVYFKKWLLGAISHGFDRYAMDKGFFWRQFVQDFTLPTWETTMKQQLKKVDLYDDVIAFDWMNKCADPNPNNIINAGKRLADEIIGKINDLQKINHHPGDVVDLHLIGHSRGAVVVNRALIELKNPENPGSKILNSKCLYGGGYVELTLLDPHPAKNYTQTWGNWDFEKNDNGDEVDCFNNRIPDVLTVAHNPSPHSNTQPQANLTTPPTQFDNSASNKKPISDVDLVLLLDFIYSLPSIDKTKLGNITGVNPEKPDRDYFIHQSRVLRKMAEDNTYDFQRDAHDPDILIPAGVKKIDIYYQHTPAYKLCYQDDQEFIQNLWGMVSPETIKCDGCVLPKPINLTGLGENIPGVGIIGHNQVPLYYEQIVEAGSLNRSKVPPNTNPNQ